MKLSSMLWLPVSAKYGQNTKCSPRLLALFWDKERTTKTIKSSSLKYLPKECEVFGRSTKSPEQNGKDQKCWFQQKRCLGKAKLFIFQTEHPPKRQSSCCHPSPPLQEPTSIMVHDENSRKCASVCQTDTNGRRKVLIKAWMHVWVLWNSRCHVVDLLLQVWDPHQDPNITTASLTRLIINPGQMGCCDCEYIQWEDVSYPTLQWEDVSSSEGNLVWNRHMVRLAYCLKMKITMKSK